MFIHPDCNNKRNIAVQFQIKDCIIPSYRNDLLLSDASFVYSHDAATGYIKQGDSISSKSGLTWRYSKNQKYDIYKQLMNGARAFDLRLYMLYNQSTIVFHHGDIHIKNINFEQIIKEIISWCTLYPTELVILLPSHYKYETEKQTTKFRNNNNNNNNDDSFIEDDYITDDSYDYYDDNDDDDDDDDNNNYYEGNNIMDTVLIQILKKYGISYYSCQDIYGWTIGETMEYTKIKNSQGSILVLLGGNCVKENWVENKIITCYSANTNHTTPCTSINMKNYNNHTKWISLRNYTLASCNNPATDDKYTLGPPLNLYNTPLYEIQALWQITTSSAIIGLSKFSSIINDNEQSHINELFMNLIYNQEFNKNSINLFAIDNVALYGNAILSVLRTQCSQTNYRPCGINLPKPKLTYLHIINKQHVIIISIITLYMIWLIYSIIYNKRPKLLYTAYSRIHLYYQSKKYNTLLLSSSSSSKYDDNEKVSYNNNNINNDIDNNNNNNCDAYVEEKR